MHVIVVGGGASGMMAALFAAAGHNEVTILEQRDRIGKKLLATGNGRCNFANEDEKLSHYHGKYDEKTAVDFVSAVFSRFSPRDAVAYLTRLGVYPKSRDGYLYPYSDQATAVLDVFLFALAEAKVRIECDCFVKDVTYGNHAFRLDTSKGARFADRLIISVGSKAGIPDKVSDGYHLCRKLGHTIEPIVPALVQLLSNDSSFKSLSGIRTRGMVQILDESRTVVAADTGELQLTAGGISGIPTFMVSHVASAMLYNHKKVKARINFLPELNENCIADFLSERSALNPNKKVEEFLIGILNKNLCIQLLKRSKISLHLSVSELTREDILALSHEISCFEIEIIGTKPFSEAQICAGGVNLTEVSTTMESKLVPGLYITGEVLDVHGDCGGYNLQWAFCSGAVAGMLL